MYSPLPSRVAVAAAVVVLVLSGCDREAPAPKSRVINVNTVTVSPSTEPVWIETVGVAEGVEQSEVRPQVSGTLTAVTYSEGEAVKAGQTLFIIDDSTYRAAFDSATASALEAKAELERNRRDLQRDRRLYETRATSKKSLEDSISAVNISEAAVRAAEAVAEDARINLERTRVKAPADGVAGRALVNVGTLVSASSTVLTNLTQPDNLRVTFQMSDRDMKNAKVDLSSNVRIVNRHGASLPARLDYVGRQFDVETATLPMRLKVLEQGRLFAGELVHVQLQIDEVVDAYRVPQHCVIQKPDGTYTVYLEQDGRAVQRKVTVGHWIDTDWVVTSGLKNGDRVIVNQLQRLRDGSQVNASPMEKKAAEPAS